MKYRVMLTTLFEEVQSRKLAYYGTVENSPRLYCDASLAVEACCKYILAKHPLDEIIAIGENEGEDEQASLTIKDGRTLYGSDLTQLSNYDLLRHQLAAYLDEQWQDDQLSQDALSEKERAAVDSLVQKFYQAKHEECEKLDRLFDVLARNKDLQAELLQQMEAKLPKFVDRKDAYIACVKRSLYDELKDSRKLEILDENTGVKLSYVSAKGMNAETDLLNKLGDKLRAIVSASEEPVELVLYLCIHNEDAFDSYLLLSLLELAKMLPGLNIKIAQTVTTRKRNAFVTIISDVTAFYGTPELITSTKAFMRYGKTELLAEYWNKQDIENDYISAVINALRVIDVGISLCDIDDIERGLNNLRKTLAEPYAQTGDSPFEKYFPLLIEAIKRDMGSLLTPKANHFIELAKWTFHKGLLQQALTLVESRAPQDMVDRGIYYYSDSDEADMLAIKVLGQVYAELKPYEKYRLDDISHYFVKNYGRNHVGRTKSKDEHQRKYAQLRVDDLDATDENVLRALSGCTDRAALYDLLYAYYHMTNVRNATNHAEQSDEIALREDSDVSVRYGMIEQALKFFIRSYERVDAALMEPEVPVHKITTADLDAFARTYRPERTPRHDNRNESPAPEVKPEDKPEAKAEDKPEAQTEEKVEAKSEEKAE